MITKEKRWEWPNTPGLWALGTEEPKGPQSTRRARGGWSGEKSDAMWCEGTKWQETKARTEVMTLWWKSQGSFWKSTPNPRMEPLAESYIPCGCRKKKLLTEQLPRQEDQGPGQGTHTIVCAALI